MIAGKTPSPHDNIQCANIGTTLISYILLHLLIFFAVPLILHLNLSEMIIPPSGSINTLLPSSFFSTKP
ncbi:hypothetical protein DVH24_013383 [Malus domestica]|uniref:Uncharacterized protein n=1 Tax=Malus domestica TaxID=3750 RepID=A0A498HML2_MALDO|nr:hypothetical protein DVH24_013383 [Malus domestica]